MMNITMTMKVKLMTMTSPPTMRGWRSGDSLYYVLVEQRAEEGAGKKEGEGNASQ